MSSGAGKENVVYEQHHGVGSAFAVVIPAKNEAEYIGRCLQSLVEVDYPREGFEVVVVDNGSADDTVGTALGFRDRLNLTVLTVLGARISGLRNAGAGRSTGRVLVFLDADCLVPKDWLRQIEARLARSTVGVLGAKPLIPADSSWIPKIWESRHQQNEEMEATYVGSANFVIERSTFDRISGFDEGIETNEDAECCARVRDLGLPIVRYRPIAVTHLRNPRTLADFFRKEQWHGKHVFRVFVENLPRLMNVKAVSLALMFIALGLGLLVG